MAVLTGNMKILVGFLTCFMLTQVYTFNMKYPLMNRQIVEDLTFYNYKEKIAENNLQKEQTLVFKNSNFPYFGDEVTRAMNYSTKSITFRRGYVEEIFITSPVLEVLQVINTHLVALKAFPFLNYKLRQLTIRSENFSHWSPSLTFLKALEEIDIAYCNFSHLEMEWFEPYTKLRALDVAKNKLTTLEIKPRLTMKALKNLNLWGNRLEWLQRFPDAFPNLQRVTLSQNRWHCNWLSQTRVAVWSKRVVLMDMDDFCPDGWIKNGGLCCSSNTVLRYETVTDRAIANDITLEELKIKYTSENIAIENGSVIAMRMGNTDVILDRPLPLI